MAVGIQALPPVRSELRLVGRRRDASGAEFGIIYDPFRHRFFDIGARATEILTHWRAGSSSRLIEQVNANSLHPISAEDVEGVVHFLHANQLLSIAPISAKPSPFTRFEMLIGKLFFFRVPLIHPDRALNMLAGALFPVLGRRVMIAFALMALAGLIFLVRQWDLFLEGFRSVSNMGGAVSLLAAVVLAKALHELGHALAAKRMGCSVPAMGIAVMFGAPLLYTDLSDTWRLARRRDRLLVAAGGILAELALAAIATWGWLILPNGPAREACFFLATVAWVATLVVNANPFLRFDGYFMLSDLMGVPNLQGRSFAEGRRVLRQVLWGTSEPPTEDMSRGLAFGMLVYAYCTWIFRATLYLGLAWTATLLPKLIAVPILLSELWVLLMRPIVNELTEWWRDRHTLFRSRRSRITALLATALCLWLVIPQSFQMALPAVRTPMQRQWIHPPRPAQLAFHVLDGREVVEGDVLAIFIDPNLEHEIAQSRLHLASLVSSEEQAARNLISARELAVLRERIASETATLAGFSAQQEGLTIRASFAGRVQESAPGLRDGGWHAMAEPLFLLVSKRGGMITAFVDDRDLALVSVGSMATFHATAVDTPVESAKVTRVEAVPSESITEPLLASITGGAIATERDGAGRAIPRQGQYRVTAEMTPGGANASSSSLPGKLMVDSSPYSLLMLGFRRLQALLIKEASG